MTNKLDAIVAKFEATRNSTLPNHIGYIHVDDAIAIVREELSREELEAGIERAFNTLWYEKAK